MSQEPTKIPITVEKSHLITIGEKLYTEKSSFIRELVNNAYDADATEVRVIMNSFLVSVKDNGSGMDEGGLRQYFTIGSELKKSETESPRFKRRRIGEFGIGKFAALAASKQFEIETQKENFRGRLVFDKESWSQHEDWHLDLERLEPSPERGNGTIVTLHNLTMELHPGTVRRYLAERTPIHIENFSVFVNDEQVTDDVVPGQRLQIAARTPLGFVTGTLIIAPPDRKLRQSGIAVCVRGILIRYESFGLETSRKFGTSRITGRINADFVPITSNRDDFIRDSLEFKMLQEIMRKEIAKALQEVREEGDRRANLQALRVLKDALFKIGRAMRKHRGLFQEAAVPVGPVAVGNDKEEAGFQISQAELLPTGAELDPAIAQKLQEQKEQRGRGRPQAILGSKSVIRKFKIANFEMAVRMEHLGGETESLISGGVIYVNLDHPLYRTYQNRDELLTLHIARVLTKELALQAGVTSASDAFSLQAELLTDAFKGKL